jgi:hypothetical protein
MTLISELCMGNNMNIKSFLPIVFAILALAGCTQTKPVAVDINGDAAIAAPGVSVAQGSVYAGTASGLMTPLGYSERVLDVQASLVTDAAQTTISGKFTAGFTASDGTKLKMAGEFAPTAVSGKAFSGIATVAPYGPNARFKQQTGTYTGVVSPDGKTVSGSVSSVVSYTDRTDNSTFTYKFDFLLPTAPAK